jgi:hypothetical protein
MKCCFIVSGLRGVISQMIALQYSWLIFVKAENWTILQPADLQFIPTCLTPDMAVMFLCDSCMKVEGNGFQLIQHFSFSHCILQS